MLLVFDIGNTNIKMGLFNEKTLVASWRMTTGALKTADEYGANIMMMLQKDHIDPKTISRVLISSVVPNIMHSFCNAIRVDIGVEPTLVLPGIKTGIFIKTENPKEVGADILTDAVAAYTLYGGPCTVVDFGTATKFIVVTGKGELIAAVISPGLGISADALGGRTAQLPLVAIQKPDSILNSNTVKCIQAGLVYGCLGQVEYIVNKIRDELGEPQMRVIATGGFGKLIAAETKSIDVYDPILTLKGLQIIDEKNQPRGGKQ
jgi:type III pantothenate kinase